MFSRKNDLQAVVKAALHAVLPEVRRLADCSTAWLSHFGAVDIGAQYLFIFLVLPTRDQVAACEASGAWNVIAEALRAALLRGGYPVENLTGQWFGVYSQQACDEEYNGNWYYFFK
ncbi:hypothetical protein [Dyella sp.]|uniref:hypothetical protein n=1 Tax=Dyella sp. TaxID=1869338 RepID=UPI002ED02D21